MLPLSPIWPMSWAISACLFTHAVYVIHCSHVVKTNSNQLQQRAWLVKRKRYRWLALPSLWYIIPIVPPVLMTSTRASALGLRSKDSTLWLADILLLRDAPILCRDDCDWNASDWSSWDKVVWDRARASEVISPGEESPEVDFRVSAIAVVC